LVEVRTNSSLDEYLKALEASNDLKSG